MEYDLSTPNIQILLPYDVFNSLLQAEPVRKQVSSVKPVIAMITEPKEVAAPFRLNVCIYRSSSPETFAAGCPQGQISLTFVNGTGFFYIQFHFFSARTHILALSANLLFDFLGNDTTVQNLMINKY